VKPNRPFFLPKRRIPDEDIGGSFHDWTSFVDTSNRPVLVFREENERIIYLTTRASVMIKHYYLHRHHGARRAQENYDRYSDYNSASRDVVFPYAVLPQVSCGERPLKMTKVTTYGSIRCRNQVGWELGSEHKRDNLYSVPVYEPYDLCIIT
jgi:hypothetical protein